MLNLPICVAGPIVDPCDLVIGDADGVTLVAREDVSWVADKCRQREEKEEKISRQLNEVKSTFELFGFSEILERAG